MIFQEELIANGIRRKLGDKATVTIYEPQDVPDERFQEYITRYELKGKIYGIRYISHISGREFVFYYPLEYKGRDIAEYVEEFLYHMNTALESAKEAWPPEKGE